MPAFGGADPLTQRVVDAGDGAIAGPAAVVVVDRLPRWKVRGQRPPHPTVVGHVPDRVDDVAAWMRRRAATSRAGSTGRDQRGQHRPLGVGGVRRISARAGRGQMNGATGRVGGCTGAGDQVEIHAGSSVVAQLVWSPVHLSKSPPCCHPDTPRSRAIHLPAHPVSGRALTRLLNDRGTPTVHHHTTGHAFPADLRRLVARSTATTRLAPDQSAAMAANVSTASTMIETVAVLARTD